MDTNTLVDPMIEDGQKLVEQLPVAAAFWLRASENGRWYFYVVSPAVETDGLAKAYGRLQTVIRQMPPSFWIHPLKVKLIEPTDPIARDITAGATGVRGRPIRWGGMVVGNLSIDEAYLYPLARGS